MKKIHMRILTLLLAIFFASCGPDYSSQAPINLSLVDSITITKRSSHDLIPEQTKSLTKEQSSLFADRWNNAPCVGPSKYLWTYCFNVYLKDSTVRGFRVNGQHIKENIDWSFDLKDTNFVQQLWTK